MINGWQQTFLLLRLLEINRFNRAEGRDLLVESKVFFDGSAGEFVNSFYRVGTLGGLHKMIRKRNIRELVITNLGQRLNGIVCDLKPDV